MKKFFIALLFVFVSIVAAQKVKAFYGVPYNSYTYSSAYYPNYYNYGYGYGYHAPGYHRNYQRRHPIKDERELKYIREYYKAVNGYDSNKKYNKGTTYQNGNKVVNVNIDM